MCSTSTNTKVLLINPNEMKPPVTPIGLDYIASALELTGFEVDLIDLCFVSTWEQTLEAYLDDNNPLAIGITIRNTDDCLYLSRDFILPRIKAITDHIKERTCSPIILGGVGFSVMPEPILSYLEVPLGLWGDGEWALPALLMKMRQGENFYSVPGLIYKTNEECRSNPPEFHDLHERPLARRDFVDNARYFREGGMGSVETKRGCAQTCIYCADPLAKGQRYRLRPPPTVADEMEILLGFGVDHLHVCDSEFNLPSEHGVRVCEEIVRRGLGERLAWYAYLSPVPFTEELARLMSQAGCQGICFGADHADDRMLHNLGRTFTAADLRRTATLCHQYEIPFMYDLLLGGPGETKESLTRAISFMQDIVPSRVGISAGVRIYPGTRLGELALEEGVHHGNPSLHGVVQPDMLAPIFYVSPHLRDELISTINALVAGDERFFFGGGEATEANYNYNDNSILMEAIRRGYRGAFWNILRRLAEEGRNV